MRARARVCVFVFVCVCVYVCACVCACVCSCQMVMRHMRKGMHSAYETEIHDRTTMMAKLPEGALAPALYSLE